MRIVIAVLSLIIPGTIHAGTVEGFINLDVPAGLNLVGIPFITGENRISDIFQNVPFGTEVYKWESDRLKTNTFSEFGWSIPDQRILQGEAVFFRNILDKDVTVTLHGQFYPDRIETNQIPSGLSALAAKAPVTGDITSKLNLLLSPFDNLYLWRTNHFIVFTFLPNGKWFPNEPQLRVGEGFFVNTATGTNWVLSLQ
jgi:hypothetical protein